MSDESLGTTPTAAPSNATKMIAIAIVVVVLVAIPLSYLYIEGQKNKTGTTETYFVTVTNGSMKANLTLASLKGMTAVQDDSSYQNRFGNWRGQGTYKGVTLRDIADIVGGMVPGDVMTVKASDGYSQNLSYYQVYPDAETLSVQGKVILAYEFNSSTIPNWVDGPMIAVLAPDAAFSNKDMNATAAKDLEFSATTSAGSIWVRNVKTIEIKHVFTEWTLAVGNLQNKTTDITRTRFVALGHDHMAYWVDARGGNWSGVPTSIILGYVDDSNSSSFNTTLADTYAVTVADSSGNSQTMTARCLVDNETIFAYKLNGTLLDSMNAPLRLVGRGLSNLQMVGKVACVNMTALKAEEAAVIVSKGTVTQSLTLTNLRTMTAMQGVSEFQTKYQIWKGLGTYKGVVLQDLAELVGGMEPGDVMTITATDGYHQNFSYYQVYADSEYLSIQGEIILAYEFNGTMVPTWTSGPRVAVLAPDEAFSNEDLNATVARDTEFASSTSASALWVSNAKYITITHVYSEWTIGIKNLNNQTTTLSRTKFVSLGYGHMASWVDSKTRNWTGVPVETILGYVDDSDPTTFNQTLVNTNYTLTLTGSDGMGCTLVAKDLIANATIFAYKLNGSILSGSYAPLRLVGAGLTGSQMVKMIAWVNMTVAPPHEETLLTLVKGTAIRALTLTELTTMSWVQATSSYQNSFGNWRGFGLYQGVRLQDLADLMGGMEPGDVMSVSAADGYEQNLSYYQVYADAEYQSIQGNIVLAYSFNGSAVPAWTAGPRVAVLAPDQAFSNVDLGETVARDYEFRNSSSAGSLWVSNVNKIRITHVFDEWTIQLTNLVGDNHTLTRTKYVQLGYGHAANWTDSKTRNWSGVPLSVVLGYVDDSDPATFNSTLADTLYTVKIAASDGYNKTLVAKYLVANGTLLAYKMNGTILSSSSAPLKLVGAGLTGSQMVSKIASVEMIPYTPPEPVVLTLKRGSTYVNYTMSQVLAMSAITEPGGLMKSTGTINGPYQYTGVSVSALVETLFVGLNFSLEVKSSDGYTMTFSSSQVISGTFEHYSMAGENLGPGNFTMILAYLQDGVPLVDMNFKIAIVDPSAPITDGHFWAKYVNMLEIKPYLRNWNLTLSGMTDMTMDRWTFESLASCPHHTVYYNFTNATGNHSYSGVPLFILVAAVDAADEPNGHYMFNDWLAEAGYVVKVSASDGYFRNFTSAQVAWNYSILVANKLDGQELADSEFPLKFVGYGLTGKSMVKMVSNISLGNITGIPDWTLNLTGTNNATVDAGGFDELIRCGIHTARYDFTNTTGFHSYQGIALWLLISAVDGDDPSGHYDFNTSLAAAGYSVRIDFVDGTNLTIPIGDVPLDDTLMLAYKLDGTTLTGSAYPLVLVGPGFLDYQQIGVAGIQLVGLPV